MCGRDCCAVLVEVFAFTTRWMEYEDERCACATVCVTFMAGAGVTW